jgi:hypothetical protein
MIRTKETSERNKNPNIGKSSTKNPLNSPIREERVRYSERLSYGVINSVSHISYKPLSQCDLENYTNEIDEKVSLHF